MGGACGTYGNRCGAYRDLVRNPETWRPLGRPRHRCKDNIKMDFKKLAPMAVDWIELAQDRDS
jgi:hypothetical protein